ncbi:hypothetical protein [Legionella clemsonensis]|uniref:Uncharacterized protein n=1 Tax=Legionella clemsonensis TaxID=1867846 RepID=A0A222P2V2_9GAMM|nr:hypothetical protein [Legionella clemsonensis]ASQ46188.1 hypothetical protein clem_08180 [Legionella clemsonensis]
MPLYQNTQTIEENKVQSINEKITFYLSNNDHSGKARRYNSFLQEKLNKAVEKIEKNNEKAHAGNLPKVNKNSPRNSGNIGSLAKNTSRVAAAAGALTVAGPLAGYGAKLGSSLAYDLGKNGITSAFDGVVSSAGIFRDPLSALTNAIGDVAGGVLGVTAGVVLPVGLLYVAIPKLYQLFFYTLNKAIDKIDKSLHPYTDLGFFPQGVYLELMCNISTLAVKRELENSFALKGIANVKFNIQKIVDKVIHPLSDTSLSEEEQILYSCVKRNATKLIQIYKDLLDSKKRFRYRQQPVSSELIKLFHTQIKADMSDKLEFCLVMAGQSVQSQQPEVHNSLYHILKQAFAVKLEDTASLYSGLDSSFDSASTNENPIRQHRAMNDHSASRGSTSSTYQRSQGAQRRESPQHEHVYESIPGSSASSRSSIYQRSQMERANRMSESSQVRFFKSTDKQRSSDVLREKGQLFINSRPG